MTVPVFFLVYLLVFLAVIFVAWLIFAWESRKIDLARRKIVKCPQCDSLQEIANQIFYARCKRCGARSNIEDFKAVPEKVAPQ